LNPPRERNSWVRHWFSALCHDELSAAHLTGFTSAFEVSVLICILARCR